MPEQEGRNRRLDFRQDDMLRMKEQVLTKDEYELEIHRTSSFSNQSGLLQKLTGNDVLHEGVSRGQVSPEVAKSLELLDAKLNYVIEMNLLQQTNHEDLEERLVNMSATGMRFTTNEFCKKGEYLKITMSLPLSPPVLLELLAEVVYISVKDGRTQVGVAFVFRCENEEDALIRYIFKRQREAIRMKYRKEVRYSRLNDIDLV